MNLVNECEIHSLDCLKYRTKEIEARSLDYLKHGTKEVDAHTADGEFWSWI